FSTVTRKAVGSTSASSSPQPSISRALASTIQSVLRIISPPSSSWVPSTLLWHVHRGYVMQLAYQPCYCEENIWRLCADGVVDVARSTVLLITNRHRTSAVWCQRSGFAGQPVVWDYHVVCLEASEDGAR